QTFAKIVEEGEVEAGVVQVEAQRISLQRHFSVLTKFAYVESRLSGLKRQREVVFYVPVNLCDRRVCSASVAVGICPIHTAPDRIGGLPIRQAFDILHDHHQGQAPGGDLHGAALWGVEIGKELIVIERAKLGAESDREVAFG